MTTNKQSRGPRGRLVAVAAAALAITTAGCLLPPDTTLSYAALAQKGRAQGDLPWFCHSDGLGGSMAHSHNGGLANDAYAGMKKGDLSWDDCTATAAMFDRTRNAVKAWPTRGAAEAAGFIEAVGFVTGLGTHHMKEGWSQYGFDPEHPYLLQFDGVGPDAKLVGVSWAAITGSAPPEGFPGKNDWWHQHNSLCAGAQDLADSDEIPDEVCAAHGGTNIHLPGLWMLHAWIFPGYEDQWDVFSGFSLCVRGTGPDADPDDLCQADIQTGPLTTITTPGSPGTVPATLPPGGFVGTATTMPPMAHDH